MKKQYILLLVLFALIAQSLEQTYSNSKIGTTNNGLSFELWKDSGTTSMTLLGGGLFKCSWSNINNALFRIGKKWDCSKTWDQLGTIKVRFEVDYKPQGNSYLCVYGWSRDPLVEYYVVESWGNWRPPGGTSRGVIYSDGGDYDLYVTDRINQPSIDGTRTFKQFWSVRKEKRTQGTIQLTKHFKYWKSKGMNLGKMYEASLTIEGYQSSGSATVKKNEYEIKK